MCCNNESNFYLLSVWQPFNCTAYLPLQLEFHLQWCQILGWNTSLSPAWLLSTLLAQFQCYPGPCTVHTSPSGPFSPDPESQPLHRRLPVQEYRGLCILMAHRTGWTVYHVLQWGSNLEEGWWSDRSWSQLHNIIYTALQHMISVTSPLCFWSEVKSCKQSEISLPTLSYFLFTPFSPVNYR